MLAFMYFDLNTPETPLIYKCIDSHTVLLALQKYLASLRRIFSLPIANEVGVVQINGWHTGL
jgi:hypothetical protein